MKCGIISQKLRGGQVMVNEQLTMNGLTLD